MPRRRLFTTRYSYNVDGIDLSNRAKRFLKSVYADMARQGYDLIDAENILAHEVRYMATLTKLFPPKSKNRK